MRTLPLLLLAGCPLPTTDEDKADTGTTADPTPADLVLVVDNSSSMAEESATLGLDAQGIVDALLADGAHDWQVGITTVTTDPSMGDVGIAGALVGDPVPLSDADAADRLAEQLLCEATCWNALELGSDPSYVCGDPATEATIEYLDCLCGVDQWKDHCGGGREEGLEAALLATCRAVDTPTDACYQYDSPDAGTTIETVFAGEEGTNDGLLRGGDVAFLVVSDEGDSSPRVSTGDADPAPYGFALDDLLPSWNFYVLGPAWDGTNGDCLNGAQVWGVERYQTMASGSGGAYVALTDLSADCASTDPMTIFDEIR